MASWHTLSADVNGVTISYLRTGGDKPSAVLLHGLMGSGATWTPVARLLEADLDVILPDARGHGRSSAPDSGYRYPDLASDVIGLVQELGLAQPVLIGHSMGGMTAALAATRIGRLLRGLVLVDPTFLSSARQREVHKSGVAEQHRDALSRGRSALLNDAAARHPGRSPELLALQTDARLATDLAAFDVLRPPNPPYRELVRALHLPTLLVIGDRSVVTLDTATELCELNPRLRVGQVDDAGHGLPFEQPVRLAEMILAFVDAIGSGDPSKGGPRGQGGHVQLGLGGRLRRGRE
jgi:pimeloyl-ACP methyl ester carboxylesterase